MAACFQDDPYATRCHSFSQPTHHTSRDKHVLHRKRSSFQPGAIFFWRFCDENQTAVHPADKSSVITELQLSASDCPACRDGLCLFEGPSRRRACFATAQHGTAAEGPVPGRGGAWILATYETQVWRCTVACIICWCIHILGMACKALLKGITKVLPSHVHVHAWAHPLGSCSSICSGYSCTRYSLYTFVHNVAINAAVANPKIHAGQQLAPVPDRSPLL